MKPEEYAGGIQGCEPDDGVNGIRIGCSEMAGNLPQYDSGSSTGLAGGTASVGRRQSLGETIRIENTRAAWDYTEGG